MMNKRKLQHELLSDLTYSISEVLDYTDLSPTEQLSFVTSKISNANALAAQQDLRNTVIGLSRIRMELNRLQGIQKSHRIPTRIKDIISTIKW